ncbi:MAG: penicillin-binding protein 2 [Leptolyngbyaceae cyanobacterium SL_5_9]|nr:penicillin-binding protein 2 [Leptolyngbyaceae cyanobacterium SM1_4_3]NJN56321.1 penicillin-binding protein 2 [Leptolyngbyaceae cyanobacterium SL_5_9]
MASGISYASDRRSAKTSLLRSSSRDKLAWRGVFLMLFMTAIMSAFVVRLTQLQLVQGEYNQRLAEQNRVRLIPIPSDRGNITDRDGKLFAANRLARSVYLWPRQQPPEQWQVTASRLGPLLNMPASEIIEQLEKVGYNSPMPVRITQQLSQNAFVALAEQSIQFPGVETIAESSRYYPHGDLAAHVLGYIGEATQEDLKENPEYPYGMIVGQMGVERLVNAELDGRWGNRKVEVNARGQELRWLGTEPALAGNQVRLTLDLDLQQTAERALAQRRGAVVVMDVKTGAVLAIASGPSFDPNIFTRRVTESEWQQLNGESQPFLNRALQGYPPGSTFKIVTAVAGLQSGKFSPDSIVNTYASMNVGGTVFNEHSGGYGPIGFRKAMAVSSNTFFYQVGIAAGPEQIAHWSEALGIGVTDLGLDGGSRGSVPTPAQKEELYGEPWYTGDTVSMSIGQGLVQVTPLEMAVVVSAIANGGWRVNPHLLTHQTEAMAAERVSTGITPENLEAVRVGLVAAVQEGTARRLNDGSIPLTAGKTGTAEVPGQEDNAVFVGYGPVDDPQIAIAVVVENGGFGGVTAVPIAHEVYKTYFGQR